MSVAVRLQGITKRFPGVLANDRIDLVVEAGEIHAICGENGAGKSTLMKILYGMQAPDEGSIEVLEQERTFSSPREAIDVGIGMVHQHFMLADNLTVIENVILGAEPSRGSLIDFATARSRLRELGDAYGLALDLDDAVGTLEVGGAAADRDHQDPLPRGPHPHPGRAHRGAGSPGGGGVVPEPAGTQGRGPHHHLHRSQTGRGAGDRRHDHGAPPGPVGGQGQA